MASMTIQMPDAHAARVITALAARSGWTAAKGAETGQTEGQAAKANVIDYMETVTKHYEAEKASTEARTEAYEQAEADIVLS